MAMNRNAVQSERTVSEDESKRSDKKPRRCKPFTIGALVEKRSPDAFSLLTCTIKWWSRLPPSCHLPASDRRILFYNCWHRVFLVQLVCQRGGGLISELKSPQLKSLLKSWPSLSLLEQWALTSLLIYNPEDGRLENKEEIRTAQLQTAQMLLDCRATGVEGSHSCQLLLTLVHLIQLPDTVVLFEFFPDKELKEIETLCRICVH